MYSRHAGMSRAGSPHDAASICLVVGIGEKSYGFLKISHFKINLVIGFSTWNAGCNDAVPWLNKATSQISQL